MRREKIKILLAATLMSRERIKIKNKKVISCDHKVVAIDPSSAATSKSHR
jgi:hypothetical protein